jgi:hypothetical protein
MSADAKKGYGSTMILMILGVLALYAGARWLLLLIPAAALVWYAASGEAATDPGWPIMDKIFDGVMSPQESRRIAQRAR